ncbi:hypothetical protein [Streptomyces buecherae]|uniref:hypothetical protein n=1 Tax=Streptomyces buecherae TaxID=2763006 RepID=UPI0036C95DE9
MSEKLSRDLRRISQLCAGGDRETHRAVFQDLAEIVGALAGTTFWSSIPESIQSHLRDFYGKGVATLSGQSADVVGLYLRLTSGVLNKVADRYDKWRATEELPHELRRVGNLIFFGKLLKEETLEAVHSLVRDLKMGGWWDVFPEGLRSQLLRASRLAIDARANEETPDCWALADIGSALTDAADLVALHIHKDSRGPHSIP